MECTLDRKTLRTALTAARSVAERRGGIPMLTHVLLESDGGGVTIAATDQETGLRWPCVAAVTAPGAVTVGAEELYRLTQGASDAVSFRSIANHGVEISAGAASFVLPGLDAKKFPALPTMNGAPTLRVASAVLCEMIDRTLFAVCDDDVMHPGTMGVFVECPEPGKLRLVATDGHRLSMITRAVDGGIAGAGVILPRKGARELGRLARATRDPLTLAVGSTTFARTANGAELSIRAIDADFPPYTKVIPSECAHYMSVAVAPLLAALRRVVAAAGKQTPGVILRCDSPLRLSYTNPDTGAEMRAEIAAEYDGVPVRVDFNARYLVDVLATRPASARVAISLVDECAPATIRYDDDPGYLYIVMPMQL